MAARIEQGVLLNIIHDHELRGITYDNKIERTADADIYPDRDAGVWTSGNMMVYDLDKLGSDTKAYSYEPLGTAYVNDGYVEYYTESNDAGNEGLFVNHYNTLTGGMVRSPIVNYTANVISWEIMLAGNGGLTRSPVDPEMFYLNNSAATYVHYVTFDPVTGATDHHYTSAPKTATGSFCINSSPAKEITGMRLGDAEEIIVET